MRRFLSLERASTTGNAGVHGWLLSLAPVILGLPLMGHQHRPGSGPER